MNKDTYEMYTYIKNGKEFYTPSERIAELRSDNGEYFVHTYNG